MRFLRTAAETRGELLMIETINPPSGLPEPMHVHPKQETSARMISGSLEFVVSGRTRRLGPGDEIRIPAGTPHRFVNDGDEDAVAVQEVRPALRTQEFFETYFDLAARGQLDEDGKPSLLAFASLGPEFGDEIRLTSPPWALQRALFAVLGPIARMRTPSAGAEARHS